jgi:hypothetical protein
VRFKETVRLPRRFLRWWITANIVVTVGFSVLWVIADMNATQRVATAVFLLVVLLWFWGGAMWFVAFHVTVDDQTFVRRVGHKVTRIAIEDIAATRVEPSMEPGSGRVILTLRDGSEQPILTRHPAELAAALGSP